MHLLAIGSPNTCQVVFHSPEYGDDGWLESYAVDLLGQGLHASVRVENPGYGHPPSHLLRELAACWKGWLGAKTWYSMEGELAIDATADSTGHTTLAVRVPGNNTVPPWSAEVKVVIEAGQLEALAQESEVFFARQAPGLSRQSHQPVLNATMITQRLLP